MSIRWVDFGFGVAYLLVWRFASKNLHFTVFLNFCFIFYEFLFQKWETGFHYSSDFFIFLVISGNDIFWNWWICIWKSDSTFSLWQFSRASFFAQKNITKKMVLEFQLSAPHLVGYGPQKEFPFDRCTYRGSLFLHFFQKF